MASRDEMTLPATRPKSRKSLGSIPSSGSVDKENATTDFAALAKGKRAPVEKPLKKSRSKSIGPGALVALKDTTGNRRKSIATVPQPPLKSILKPTIPPLGDIPAFATKIKGSPKKVTPQSANQTGNLIDFDIDPTQSTSITGAENLSNPFQVDGNPAVNDVRVTLKTEEEQQAAVREREEKERQELEKEAISRRDARRKSLANRRVSFAPDATLHTWDTVVEYQDSTTSSNATNSTRRALSVAAPRSPGPPNSDPSEPPSTPPEQIEEDTVNTSPDHQRDLHQKKRRRSSGIPPMNFNNPDDTEVFSSPYSGSSAGDGDEIMGDDNDDSIDSDEADETAMSMDGETTDMSMASIKSGASTSSSTRLDDALREAARQAGTSSDNFDDSVAEEVTEVVASFAPFAKSAPLQALESNQDQENVNPFTGGRQPNAAPANGDQSDGEDVTMDITMDMTRPMGRILPPQQTNDDEMSIDVTRAFGGIISNEAPATKHRRKSAAPNHRRSTRRKSAGEDSSMGEETMDLTTAVGGIREAEDEEEDEDEDMTMEFTTAVGGVLSQAGKSSRSRRQSMPTQKRQKHAQRESVDSSFGDEPMDMTTAVGGIMVSSNRKILEKQDPTITMEMTTALGGILQGQKNVDRTQGKRLMELETDMSSPFREVVPSSPKLAVPSHTVASETGSPSMTAFRGKGLRRSTEVRKSTTPKSQPASSSTPIKKPTTPSKQLTPQSARPLSPGKTPPSKNVTIRSASPKKLFKDELRDPSHSSVAKKVATPNKLFQKDLVTGSTTPNFVLTPQKRRISGIGLDRDGLGSPRVAAMLDRRGSIGEQARSFSPAKPESLARGVRFQDPRAMEEEIDREREQEKDRENGRSILEREVDQGEGEKDVTLNLKEMIQSLTPKKKPMKPRKSLHVGAAKGILGKRPAELDEDEDDEDEGGMKRLKGHQGSPVKNVRLQGPPSKSETTTGRMTRAARKSLEESSAALSTPTTYSPKRAKVTTPRDQGRFKDAEANLGGQPIAQPSEKPPVEDPQINEESFDDDRIQLQDFLNMTSIRFMELTTTKRRHTIAPKSSRDSRDIKDNAPVSLENCVAAGTAVIPMLELFQHACHELKSYISEGRKTVREIETDTFEENPPLFREYISATPDIKLVMDNQLKNVKTHARLLSKEMWYDWRMTLHGTLKEGLLRTGDGMIRDEKELDRQLKLLNYVIPELVQRVESLQIEESDLQAAADDLANCDPDVLSNVRQDLIAVDADVKAKKRMVQDLQRQLEAKEVEIASGVERKQACLDDIRDAEKVREENRGWASNEISSLKAKVDAIEGEHGWTITGVSGTMTSMTYRKDIELVFDAASFLSKPSQTPSQPHEDSRIDLWYIGANRELDPQPLTEEKDFFLQCIRDHIRGLPQSQTLIADLLLAVSVSWNKALAVDDDIRLLTISCPTDLSKTSDNSVVVKSTLLIAPLTTKVEISISLSSQSGPGAIDVDIVPSASVVYGERFNEPKMGEFLLNRCGNVVEEKGKSTKASWGGAVAELGEKLLARGRK
ncbi:putative kinetochore protein spc7 [Amylocarpus encephaloides]|uniref:Kinetochore protein spc7 n=1 Tax=Amylocarpus encephaloides TaxID=45428 RepID=A0A9P7YI99_9HELO|nr:putative kinetochore protein spc7 [Amylocarpus encephaloides]